MSEITLTSCPIGGRLSRRRIISMGLIFSIVVASSSFTLASGTRSETQEEKIEGWKQDLMKKGVGEKSRWEVRLLDGRKIKGYTGEIREDGFTLVDWGTQESSDIAFSEMESLKDKNSLSIPAKIGIIAGLAVGAVFLIGAIVLAQSEGD